MSEFVKKDERSKVNITQAGIHGVVHGRDHSVCVRWSFGAGIEEVAKEIDRHSLCVGVCIRKDTPIRLSTIWSVDNPFFISGTSQGCGSARSIAPEKARAIFPAAQPAQCILNC